MGSNTFYNSVRRGTYPDGTTTTKIGNIHHIQPKYSDWPNAQTAFEQLCDDDRYKNGHSYSGGIGMKHDFVRIATVKTMAEASALADKLVDERDPRIDDKWGPAGCITITDDPEYQFLFFGWASS